MTNSFVIKYTGYKTHVSNETRLKLDSIAGIMKMKPVYFCKVIFYFCDVRDIKLKAAQWDRLDYIANYLIKKQGLDANRIIMSHLGYEDGCDRVRVLLTDKGLDTMHLSAPHPNLRRKAAASEPKVEKVSL